MQYNSLPQGSTQYQIGSGGIITPPKMIHLLTIIDA